jgi:hypothetical protein
MMNTPKWGRKETIIFPPHSPIYTYGAVFFARGDARHGEFFVGFVETSFPHLYKSKKLVDRQNTGSGQSRDARPERGCTPCILEVDITDIEGDHLFIRFEERANSNPQHPTQ